MSDLRCGEALVLLQCNAIHFCEANAILGNIADAKQRNPFRNVVSYAVQPILDDSEHVANRAKWVLAQRERFQITVVLRVEHMRIGDPLRIAPPYGKALSFAIRSGA